MRDNALIRARNAKINVEFIWTRFDGDDCFKDFRLVVTTDDETQEFRFGACAVFGLKKLSRLFRGGEEPSANLGFKNPDIRYCDVLRLNDGYSINIKFEGNDFSREFVIQEPSLALDDDFLTQY